MRRRTFIAGAAAGLGAPTVARLAATRAAEAPASASPVRVGIVGTGNRGTYLLKLLLAVPGAQVRAVCDIREPSAQAAADTVREATGEGPAIHAGSPDSYAKMLERDDLDAILIATPTKWHCSMAIAALAAGKHTGSEVPAGFDLAELRELVATKERSGKRYMLLENYAYQRASLALCRMAREGVLGELYYAESAYIHDCRFMLFKEDGSLDWWGEWASTAYGHDYPTHGLGPVSKWLGMNDGDRLVRLSALMSTPRVLSRYVRKRFGPESPQAKLPWSNGDFTSVMIQTAKGKLIRTDYDVNSPRPMSNYYLLQGTGGVYDSRAGFYFDGKPERWEAAEPHLAAHEHSWWRESGAEAAAAGHGGGDYFVVRDFVAMARQDREPWIDVYDAATWSAVYHCSRASIDGGGASVEMPDFTGGRWQDPGWRAESMRPV